MENAGKGGRRLRVTSSQIDVSDVSARVLFPTPQQGPWMPFERFAETIATSRKAGGTHPHANEEVAMYVLEGYVDHTGGGADRTTLGAGSVLLLTAREELRHNLVLPKGRTARWVSAVVGLPKHALPPAKPVQLGTTAPSPAGADGSVVTPLVGPDAPVHPATGMEMIDIQFESEGTGFYRVGRDRAGVAYVLAGSGSIDHEAVVPGEGALLENVAGVAIGGTPGFRVTLATAPRRLLT